MFFLTPRNSHVPVFIPTNITKNLLQFDINSIRYLYEQCFVKGLSCILNHSKGMHESKQIHALLKAVNRSKPSLIVCHRAALSKWCYELSVGLKIILAHDLIENTNDNLKNFDAVLVPHDQLKHIKTISIDEWFLFVVDDIDLVIKSRFIKNVNVDFRIAITTHNFLVNPDSELQWSIMKWTNPELVENKNDFAKADKVIKRNLLQQFPDYWQRLSWSFFQNIKPTEADTMAYEMTVQDWCNKNMAAAFRTPEVKTRSIKRTSGKNKRAITSGTRRAKVGATKKRRISSKIKSTKETSDINTDKDCYPKNNIDIKIESPIKSPESDITDNIPCSIENPPKYDHCSNISDNQHDTNIKPTECEKPFEIRTSSSNMNVTDIGLNVLVPKGKVKSPNPYGFMSDDDDPLLYSLFLEDDISIANKNSISQQKSTKAEIVKVGPDNHSDSDTEDLTPDILSPSKFKNIKPFETHVIPLQKDETVHEEANFILDSLIESPQPACNVGNTEEPADEETCAILDLLL